LLDERRAHWRRVLALALPVLAQQLLVFLVGFSDRVLAGRLEPLPRAAQAEALGHRLQALGHFANSAAGSSWAGPLAAEVHWEAARRIHARHLAYQSAQTTANYLAWFITSYTMFVSVGGTALVARFIGAGDLRGAVHATNQSIVLAAALGLVGSTAGLIGLDGIIYLLQLRGDAAVFAADYLRPLFLLLIFQVLSVAGIACLVGAGDTRTGFWVLGGVAVLNVPLAWGLFLGIGPLPELRFVGIAVGTAISHTVGGLAVLAVLAQGRAGLRLQWRLLWPQWDLLRRLLRISIPAGVDSLSLAAGHLWFLSIVNRLGDTASTAHGIALGWEALGYLSGMAFGTAAMTLVGQNLGARRPAQAAQSGWVAFGLGCGVMCLMGVVFFLLAPQMFALMCPYPEQRPAIAVGVPVLRLAAFSMPALASIIVFMYALRGAGDTRVPVLFGWFGFLAVRIPLAFIFTAERIDLGALGTWPGGNLGLFGAWMAMFADLHVRGGFFLWRFVSGRWQALRV
jgi:putative MATE family efflux protein